MQVKRRVDVRKSNPTKPGVSCINSADWWGMVWRMARRPGTPCKGDRVLTVSRLQRPVSERVQAEASRHGVSVSAYIADVLAAHLGMPEHVHEIDVQEVLPLAV